MEGFPTFVGKKISIDYSFVGVNIFGNASRKDTMIIKVIPEDADDVAIRKSEGLVGQLIYVNWPYPRLAKITGFMTREIAVDPNAFDREIRVVKEKLLTTRGIDVGIVSFFEEKKLFRKKLTNLITNI